MPGNVPATRIRLAAVRFLLGFISSVYLGLSPGWFDGPCSKTNHPDNTRPQAATFYAYSYGLPILHPRDGHERIIVNSILNLLRAFRE
jgi:hypothetical protein